MPLPYFLINNFNTFFCQINYQQFKWNYNFNYKLIIFYFIMQGQQALDAEFSVLLNKRISSNLENEEHYFVFQDRKYVIHPNVFSPEIFPNCHWFFNGIIDNIDNPENFLQIGTGCGVVLIQLALRNKIKKGMGIDINPQAIQNAKVNSKLHNVDLEWGVSDVFKNVDKTHKFDVMFWSFPFIRNQKKREDMNQIQISLFDPGYVIMEQFLRQAKGYLTQTGYIIITFSKDIGNVEKFAELREKYGWKSTLLVERETKKEESSYHICLYKLSQY